MNLTEEINKDFRKVCKTDKERKYHCKHCGLVIDRDLNAAINIRRVWASRP
nr:transposase [Helicobacter pylori]